MNSCIKGPAARARRKSSGGASLYAYPPVGGRFARVFSRTARRPVGTPTYCSYNSRNLITRIDSTQEGFTPNTFGYNALGQRIRITDSTGTKWYVWDGLDILLEHDGSGTLLRRYTHGHTAIPGVGSLIAVEDAEGNVYFYHLDPLGGIHRLTDIDQAIAKLYEFGPFGRMLEETGTAPNEFVFPATYLHVPDLPGRPLSPARVFDATHGRFTQRDRGLLEGSYGFAGTNPLASADPTGLQARLVFELRGREYRGQIHPHGSAELYLRRGGKFDTQGAIDGQLVWHERPRCNLMWHGLFAASSAFGFNRISGRGPKVEATIGHRVTLHGGPNRYWRVSGDVMYDVYLESDVTHCIDVTLEATGLAVVALSGPIVLDPGVLPAPAPTLKADFRADFSPAGFADVMSGDTGIIAPGMKPAFRVFGPDTREVSVLGRTRIGRIESHVTGNVGALGSKYLAGSILTVEVEAVARP